MTQKLNQKKFSKSIRRHLNSLNGVRELIEDGGEYYTNDLNSQIPVVNEFTSIEQYQSYIDTLIVATKKELSNSKKKLAKLRMAFKFDSDGKLMEMNFVRFLFNLVMWRPFIVTGIPVTSKDIFNPKVFLNSRYAQFFNDFADKHRDKFTMAEFSEILYYVAIDMNRIAVELGPIFGASISVFDMVKMAKRNHEIRDIINTEIDPEMQVHEIEEFLRGQTERFFNLLMNESDSHNPLKPFMKTGTGVNKNQVAQTFINLGFKPDLEGHTLPIISDSNLMTEGFNSPEAVFADSKGGRKAAVLQLGVAESGYFGRHSSFAASDVVLNEDPTYACDTVNFHTLKIETERDLQMKEGQFYKTGEKSYKLLSVTDKHLIGQTLKFRSPATCAGEGKKVCKACYGAIYNINVGIHAGLFASVDSNESKTQLGLSARHVLTTSSSYIELVDEHHFLTSPNGWLYSLSPNVEWKKYELVISPTDVLMESEENYDRSDNYLVRKLVIRSKENDEISEIYDVQDSAMYLGKQLYDYLKENKFFNMDETEVMRVPLKKMDLGQPFVFMRIKNDELTKPIKELSSFIQKGKKQFDDVRDYDDFIKKLNNLYRLSSINIPSVHIEMILRNLIRDKKNPLQIPDWTKVQDPKDYVMVSLNDSVLLANSVMLGLMFEKIKKQIRTPQTYQKNGSSIWSMLFVNE